MKNLLSIESLTAAEIFSIVDATATMKSTRTQAASKPLNDQCWGLIFSKSSTRTRVSFEVGIRELGGDAIFWLRRISSLVAENPLKIPLV